MADAHQVTGAIPCPVCDKMPTPAGPEVIPAEPLTHCEWCGAEYPQPEEPRLRPIDARTGTEGGGQVAYAVEARLVGRGVSEVARKESVIAFDSSPASGPQLPGPAELLGAAFAACLLKNVERFSELLPFRRSGASARVERERQESPPHFTRIRYALRVATD